MSLQNLKSEEERKPEGPILTGSVYTVPKEKIPNMFKQDNSDI